MESSNRKEITGPCVICGVEGLDQKFQRFTENAKKKAEKLGTLDKNWKVGVTQFCHNHYMKFIVHGDGSQPDVVMNTELEVSNDGRINEIDFIASVRSMARIFYEREKKENQQPIYNWRLLREELESKNSNLIPFLNMLEKLIDPNDKGLLDNTISQQQKGLSFLCYFLSGIGNKHISAMKKDITMFLDQSGTSNQGIDTFSNMQLCTTSRENLREKGAISLIHKENVAKELSKHQRNVIIANVDDYHNIHGLRIPTTTSTSAVSHMTTILAIPISQASAIPKNIVFENGDHHNIHNPLLVDDDLLISQMENHYMTLLSQTYNNRFANQSVLSEDELLDNLTVHCYYANIHEKRKEQQLSNTLLVDFIKLDLHSMDAYIKAMEVFNEFPEFQEYLQHNVIPLAADWPGQIYTRRALTIQPHNNKIPQCVRSFIPIMGPLHVSLNSHESVVIIFHSFFDSAQRYIFGPNKKLAEKPRPWRINLLLQLMSDAWKNVAPHIIQRIEPYCFRDMEYLTLKTLLDDTIPLVLNIYAPLIFLSDVWYWNNINHPIIEILKNHLTTFNDYPVENYHSLIRRQTKETDTAEQLSRAA